MIALFRAILASQHMDAREVIRKEAVEGRVARRRNRAAVARRSPFCLALGAALAAALVGAPVAFAASAGISGNVLSYVAAPGETNDVSVSASGSDIVITDSGSGVPIADAGGCTIDAGPPSRAVCPAGGVTSISIDLGDGNDSGTIANDLALPVSLSGGDGDDVLEGGAGNDVLRGNMGDDSINSRDSAADQVYCGDGSDFVAADGQDTFPLANCERITTNGPAATIDSGPFETKTDSATFEFSSPEPNVTFQCSLDGSNFEVCTSPITYGTLTEGAHIFTVQALDVFGNPGTEVARAFVVSLQGTPGSGLTSRGQTSPPQAGPARRLLSFVLIAGRTINVNRKRVASVSLNCAGTRDCAGRLTLTTAKRVSFSRRRKKIVTLGSTKFFIRAPKSQGVKVRLSKRKFRLVKRLRRLPVTITIVDTDSAGRKRISTRDVFLRAL
jgi:hypothetical protein